MSLFPFSQAGVGTQGLNRAGDKENGWPQATRSKFPGRYKPVYAWLTAAFLLRHSWLLADAIMKMSTPKAAFATMSAIV